MKWWYRLWAFVSSISAKTFVVVMLVLGYLQGMVVLLRMTLQCPSLVLAKMLIGWLVAGPIVAVVITFVFDRQEWRLKADLTVAQGKTKVLERILTRWPK